ncbi:MAG TPA: flagellar hook assembly protein FlgD [Casimicrobiaceae bacterium]|nr:flagellar hook assembly protein FlgD [Casimicrobiaceae bacterium]
MAAVDSTQSTTASGLDLSGLSSGTTAANGTDSASDRFLTLLVTQLKNQDPLNPLDNAQITSQLAQLSTVSGINQLNTTLSQLSASMDAKQYLQAASLVGHSVVADGNAMTLADKKATGAFELGDDADRVTVQVKDPSGQIVRTIDLGAQSAGVVTFDWDGANDSGAAMNDGKYTLAVSASSSGKTVTATPLAVGEVKGLIPGANGGTLNVDGVGRVDLSSVRQIS